MAHAVIKDARISKVIESVPLEIAMNQGRLQPNHVFPTTYPWQAIKEAFSEGLTKFGNYCSIAIGLLTILSIIKIFMYTRMDA